MFCTTLWKTRGGSLGCQLEFGPSIGVSIANSVVATKAVPSGLPYYPVSMILLKVRAKCLTRPYGHLTDWPHTNPKLGLKTYLYNQLSAPHDHKGNCNIEPQGSSSIQIKECVYTSSFTSKFTHNIHNFGAQSSRSVARSSPTFDLPVRDSGFLGLGHCHTWCIK